MKIDEDALSKSCKLEKKCKVYSNLCGSELDTVSEQMTSSNEENKELLESMIDYKRDFIFDYFGFKTLERAYLLKCNNVISKIHFLR